MLEQDPFLEKPDEHKPEPDQLFCYRDASRPCNASCVAFLGFGEEPTEIVKGSTVPLPGKTGRCALLVSAHRTGKHLTILAGEVAAIGKIIKTNDLDRKAGR
jgi:hypothetical protein